MAPLEYTLTTTQPSGSSTNPVDCRYRGSGLAKAPVLAATASASALWPTGNCRPCLAIRFCVAASPSTDRATTETPRPARPSRERWKPLSCALQYGHYPR
jgi:hypothetical protein